jgi:hypothetical protein
LTIIPLGIALSAQRLSVWMKSMNKSSEADEKSHNLTVPQQTETVNGFSGIQLQLAALTACLLLGAIIGFVQTVNEGGAIGIPFGLIASGVFFLFFRLTYWIAKRLRES